MTEIILNTSALPEPLPHMIRTEKVKIHEAGGGVISLTPVEEGYIDCPLRGIASDSKLTVERFLALSHEGWIR